MASYTFLYRCPTTGHKVQGIVRDTPAAPTDTATYETVTCTACARVHLINPRNGRVAGTDAVCRWYRSMRGTGLAAESNCL